MSTKAPTPVALGTGVSVMLTKIRTKIRQTANQFRRTKRRTSTSDSLTPSVVSIPVELTLPYTRPTLSQSSLISQDMVAEEDAWWIRDRQSHPPFVPGVPSWATPLPSPLDLEDPSFTLPCWPVEQVVECSSFDGEEMDTASYSSPSSGTTSFSIPSSQSTLSESIHSVDRSTPPYPSAASSPRQAFQTDDSRLYNDDNALTMDLTMCDANDHEIRHDNDALPYYGTTLIPLPKTPIPTPAPKTECEGVKRLSKQLPASTSLAYNFHGPNLCVTVSAPDPCDSAHHNLAIDEIFREMALKPDLASIDVTVPTGCDDLPYAAKLMDDILCVLQGCSIAPQSIAVGFPFIDHDGFDNTIPLVVLDDDDTPPKQFRKIVSPIEQRTPPSVDRLERIPSLTKWWHHGRINLSQLSSLIIAYPLHLDDFYSLVSSGKHVRELSIGSLVTSREVGTPKATIVLDKLARLSIASDAGLHSVFRHVRMPGIKRLRLLMGGGMTTPHRYNLPWDTLDYILVQCAMTSGVEDTLWKLCGERNESRMITITNTAEK
ncbi:hypothetical protein ONZ45_g6430 [Pleurotus djamor]|nr:hypothetical protein ONZ45_g6430 [Pleurotus djamor]